MTDDFYTYPGTNILRNKLGLTKAEDLDAFERRAVLERAAETIKPDQNEAYGKAIRTLKRSSKLDKSVQHRQVKYLNNRLEADHGALKRLINPTRGFKTMPAASATIKGFEVMRMIRKRKCLMLESGTAGEGHLVSEVSVGEVRFVNRLFRLAA
jgi:IS6 family transposase